MWPGLSVWEGRTRGPSGHLLTLNRRLGCSDPQLDTPRLPEASSAPLLSAQPSGVCVVLRCAPAHSPTHSFPVPRATLCPPLRLLVPPLSPGWVSPGLALGAGVLLWGGVRTKAGGGPKFSHLGQQCPLIMTVSGEDTPPPEWGWLCRAISHISKHRKPDRH